MCLWVKKFWRDEAGVIISAELILILTIVVLGVVVGLVQVRNAIVAEFHDVGLAFSHLNQSYGYKGFCVNKTGYGLTSWAAGSSYADVYSGGSLAVVGDIGFVDAGGAGYFGSGYYGAGFAYGRLGTIVLADGTFVPLSLVAHGTWSLPGGALLVEYSSHPGLLALADGTLIAYLSGGPGIVELAGGVMIAARPGVAGNLVLSDGRIATFSATDTFSVTLADGTVGRFHAANLNHVILANGTSLAVSTGEAGTLVLADGRVLRLHDAVSFLGGRAVTAGTIVLADGTLIPASYSGAGRWTLAGGAVLSVSATEAGKLVLADGSSIPLIIGESGLVELADGQLVPARPGAAGTVVLSDGRLATFSATDARSVTLADGLVARFHTVAADHVVLSNGTSVIVKSGAAGTLVLPDGRVLRLSDAILPEGALQLPLLPILSTARQVILLPGMMSAAVPSAIAPLALPVPEVLGLPAPSLEAPGLPYAPGHIPQPDNGGGGLPTYKRSTPGRCLQIEIPAGPIPQYLPQA